MELLGNEKEGPKAGGGGALVGWVNVRDEKCFGVCAVLHYTILHSYLPLLSIFCSHNDNISFSFLYVLYK